MLRKLCKRATPLRVRMSYAASWLVKAIKRHTVGGWAVCGICYCFVSYRLQGRSGSSSKLTAVRLIGLVAAIVAAIAEPAARNALVDRLAFELVVGTGVH